MVDGQRLALDHRVRLEVALGQAAAGGEQRPGEVGPAGDLAVTEALEHAGELGVAGDVAGGERLAGRGVERGASRGVEHGLAEQGEDSGLVRAKGDAVEGQRPGRGHDVGERRAAVAGVDVEHPGDQPGGGHRADPDPEDLLGAGEAHDEVDHRRRRPVGADARGRDEEVVQHGGLAGLGDQGEAAAAEAGQPGLGDAGRQQGRADGVGGGAARGEQVRSGLRGGGVPRRDRPACAVRHPACCHAPEASRRPIFAGRRGRRVRTVAAVAPFEARVCRVDRGAVDVLLADGSVARAVIPHALLSAGLDDPTALPTVGDRVRVDPDGGLGVEVVEVLPRSALFVRAVADERSRVQVLAANLDVVAITAPCFPYPDLGRLERFLALAWESGSQPAVLLTKADLVADRRRPARRGDRRGPRVPGARGQRADRRGGGGGAGAVRRRADGAAGLVGGWASRACSTPSPARR